MSENEMIMQKLDLLISEVQALKQSSNPDADTRLIDLPTMARELGFSESNFRNTKLPVLIAKGIIKKYGGRYKARRCDFETLKRES